MMRSVRTVRSLARSPLKRFFKLLRSIFRPTLPLYRNMTRATATWNGKVLAETDTFETVEGNIYFPASSIHKENFKESSHETVCGWKGTASYYDIVVDGNVNKEAAWYYAKPKDAAKNITGMVAFWKGVEVRS